MKALVYLAILAICTIAGWAGFNAIQKWKQGEVREVPRTKVRRGDLAFPISTKGALQGGNSKMLIAPMTGSQQLTITQLSKPGDLVKEGEVIVEFDTTEEAHKLREAESDLAEAEQQVAQAKAESQAREEELNTELILARGELEQARLECRRNPLLAAIVVQQNNLMLKDAQDKLAKLESEYPQRKSAARASVNIQEASLKKASVLAGVAKSNIEKMTLKAPASGYVNIESNTNSNFFFPGMTFPAFQIGDSVRAGMAVAQIPDLAHWDAAVVITESDRGLISVGQTGEVRVVAIPGRALKAKVSNLGGTTGPPWNRRFECKLTLEDTLPNLRPGMSVNVVISTESLKNVLWVPTQAVFESDGRTFVHAFDKGSFVAKDVKIVRRGESQVVITGVSEGTEVALASPDQKDNAKPQEKAKK
jgi:multidrug efflux pump subunit AcrA (membrane-fusion protein)